MATAIPILAVAIVSVAPVVAMSLLLRPLLLLSLVSLPCVPCPGSSLLWLLLPLHLIIAVPLPLLHWHCHDHELLLAHPSTRLGPHHGAREKCGHSRLKWDSGRLHLLWRHHWYCKTSIAHWLRERTHGRLSSLNLCHWHSLQKLHVLHSCHANSNS